MNQEQIIEAVTKEFTQKFREVMKDLSLDDLTPELAEQFSKSLQQCISDAARVGYKTFIESYDIEEDVLEVEGKKMRYKYPSKKTF
jgi:hypothetical protein